MPAWKFSKKGAAMSDNIRQEQDPKALRPSREEMEVAKERQVSSSALANSRVSSGVSKEIVADVQNALTDEVIENLNLDKKPTRQEPELTDEVLESLNPDKKPTCFSEQEICLLSDITSIAKVIALTAKAYREKVEGASVYGRKRGNAYHNPEILTKLRERLLTKIEFLNRMMHRLGRTSAFAESQNLVDKVLGNNGNS
jgi:hypothetical protein